MKESVVIEAKIDGEIVQFDADYWDHSANGVRLIKDGQLVAVINNNTWSYLRNVTKYDGLAHSNGALGENAVYDRSGNSKESFSDQTVVFDKPLIKG